jgi:uncharacterized protein YndB with AHSA1/START domain
MTTTDDTSSALSIWSLDREVVIMRVIDAPRESLYAAWIDPVGFGSWFGPEGYATAVTEMEARVGGLARFTMTYTDGTVYTNRYSYVEVVPNERLIMIHGSDIDNDPGRFRVTVTFDAQSDGKTVVTLRQLHPTVEQRNAVIGFGAVELGLQTLHKLEQHIQSK